MGLNLNCDTRCTYYNIEMAKKFGLNESIILSHIIRSIDWHIDHNETDEFFLEGRWWMYDGAPDIANKTALTLTIVYRTLAHLKKLKILRSSQFKNAKGDSRNWYTVDVQILNNLLESPPPPPVKMTVPPSCQNDSTPPVKMTVPPCQNDSTPYCQNDSVSLLSITKISNIKTNIASVTPLSDKKPRTKKPKKEKLPEHTAKDLEIAKEWLEYAERESPWRKGTKTWTPEVFAEGAAKIRKAVSFNGEPLNHTGLRAILNFVNAHSFWASRCCSPIELLKITDKDSGRRKIDTILSQMKPDSFRQVQKMNSWAPLTAEEMRNPFC